MTASTPPTFSGTSAGRIYDRGYRPFDGARGGRRESVLALFKLSVRRALGLRRSWRQKILPWLLLGIATIPAVIQVGVQYITRDAPIDDFHITTYREYIGHSNVLLLFVAVAAPDVMCPDRRQRTLPLIFARPLTAMDYVIAKVGAIFAIVFGFAFVPQVVLFIGEILVSDAALDYVGDNADVLWKVPLAVAVLAFFYASISVALASLTSRRLIAAAVFLVSLMVTFTVSQVMLEVTSPDRFSPSSIWGLSNLASIPLHLRDIIFLGHIDPSSGLGGVTGGGVAAAIAYVALVAAAWGVLWLRYGEQEVR